MSGWWILQFFSRIRGGLQWRKIRYSGPAGERSQSVTTSEEHAKREVCRGDA